MAATATNWLKHIPGVRPAWRAWRRLVGPATDQYADIEGRTDEELLSIMRHEAHRIEKSMYNDIFDTKRDVYAAKRDRILQALAILERRGFETAAEPTVQWVRQIIGHFDALDVFIEQNSRTPDAYTPANAARFAEFVRLRRSCRVWHPEQPPVDELRVTAGHMIDAARWAPTSGNRQPWRFAVITQREKKELLRGLKEEHCISGPLLLFVGMDSRVYGALGRDEASLYLDAGAAIMQMVLTAHDSGLGVCWNHFAMDLIRTRPANVEIYQRFAEAMHIPRHVLPVAIIAIGRPLFIPPEPARTDIGDLLLSCDGTTEAIAAFLAAQPPHQERRD